MVLSEIDSLTITLLTDNYTDRLLPTIYPSIRPALVKKEQFLPPPPPIAEHGFSAFIRATCYDKGTGHNNENIVLFDCGTSENGVVHNADILGIDFDSIQSIVLSHGHFDHFTGLSHVLGRIDKPMKMICHPDAFLKRWIVFPNGKDKAKLPFLNIDELARQKLNIIFKKGPSLLSKGNIADYKDTLDHETDNSLPTLLITGQIPRHTTYEKGFPFQYKEDPTNGNLIHDPLVNDDQAMIANIKDKGLVIISGCAHAGIINTINYAKLLSGVEKVFAVVGGFHLTGGGIYEDAIEPTIRELKAINVNYLVPCHCTGWKATNRIIQEFPDKFLQPSTCTTFTFDSTTN
jgi:7,8-dihydropterin-6-yl-methyl-4-(beta-D-ribofuranosyl)aminobenzene 5'-phosphate synthase